MAGSLPHIMVSRSRNVLDPQDILSNTLGPSPATCLSFVLWNDFPCAVLFCSFGIVSVFHIMFSCLAATASLTRSKSTRPSIDFCDLHRFSHLISNTTEKLADVGK